MDKSIVIKNTRQLAHLLHMHKQMTLTVEKNRKALDDLTNKINTEITNLEKHYYGNSEKSETK